MGLIGNLAVLLAGGSRHVQPPQPPRPDPDPAGARPTSAAPPSATHAPDPAGSAPVARGGDSPAPTGVQASQGAPATGAQSVPRRGTPAESSPTRPDFGVPPRRGDEDAARAFAIAAQAAERTGNLIRDLAERPADASALPVPPAGAGINATLATLRGENAAGAVLDKVA